MKTPYLKLTVTIEPTYMGYDVPVLRIDATIGLAASFSTVQPLYENDTVDLIGAAFDYALREVRAGISRLRMTGTVARKVGDKGGVTDGSR